MMLILGYQAGNKRQVAMWIWMDGQLVETRSMMSNCSWWIHNYSFGQIFFPRLCQVRLLLAILPSILKYKSICSAARYMWQKHSFSDPICPTTQNKSVFDKSSTCCVWMLCPNYYSALDQPQPRTLASSRPPDMVIRTRVYRTLWIFSCRCAHAHILFVT